MSDFCRLSKARSVAVFAFGTTVFALTTLVSIFASLMVLSVAFMSGMMGRVTSMCVVSEMQRHAELVIRSFVEDIMSQVTLKKYSSWNDSLYK